LSPILPTSPKADNNSPHTRQRDSEPRSQLNLNLEPSVILSTSEEERASFPHKEASSPRARLSPEPALVSFSFDTIELAESPTLIHDNIVAPDVWQERTPNPSSHEIVISSSCQQGSGELPHPNTKVIPRTQPSQLVLLHLPPRLEVPSVESTEGRPTGTEDSLNLVTRTGLHRLCKSS
jgi:hypothetical protein